MAFVVASRRPGTKPSLAASLPASLFGTFSPNGVGSAEHKAAQDDKNRRATRRVDAMAHPKDEPLRSEKYLRLVAMRPCKNCSRQKSSQAAHLPPAGKAIKQDDRETFPLCSDGPRRRGCHTKFDQYELFPHDKAMKQGRKWAAETRAEIEADGLWPKGVAKWPKKGRA